jgi:hypothetical protein
MPLDTERLNVQVSESDTRVRIVLNGGNGNIIAGGNGADGDLVLRSGDEPPVDRIHLNADKANMWIGGNNADGDIVIFPRGALNRGEGSDVNESTIHLDGDTGNLNLKGSINLTGPVAVDELLPGFSTDEGAVSAFQGSQKSGVVEFTHSHPHTGTDREKLREVWIFNPKLTSNSIVLLTAHAGGHCVPAVYNMTTRHDITGGIGRFISAAFIHKVSVGNRVKIRYFIIN